MTTIAGAQPEPAEILGAECWQARAGLHEKEAAYQKARGPQSDSQRFLRRLAYVFIAVGFAAGVVLMGGWACP